jgi:hypothetical protein
MPKQVTDVELLKEYINGVMGRADHHAEFLNEIALAIIGAIVWKKDEEPIEVRTRKGEMKNVLWVKINKVRYAFSYNRETKTIDLTEEKPKGKLIHSFSNSTSLSEVRRVFEEL